MRHFLFLAGLLSFPGHAHLFVEAHAGYGTGYLRPAIKFGNPTQGSLSQFQQLSQGQHVSFLNHVSRKKSWLHGFSGGMHLGGDWEFSELPVTLGLMAGGSFLNARGSSFYPQMTAKVSSVNNNSKLSNVTMDQQSVVFHDRGYVDTALRLGTKWLNTFFVARIGWSLHRLSSRFANFNGRDLRFSPAWVSCLLTGIGMDISMTRSLSLGLGTNLHVGKKLALNKWDLIPSDSALQDTLKNSFGSISFRTRPVLWEAMMTIKYRLF